MRHGQLKQYALLKSLPPTPLSKCLPLSATAYLLCTAGLWWPNVLPQSYVYGPSVSVDLGSNCGSTAVLFHDETLFFISCSNTFHSVGWRNWSGTSIQNSSNQMWENDRKIVQMKAKGITLPVTACIISIDHKTLLCHFIPHFWKLFCIKPFFNIYGVSSLSISLIILLWRCWTNSHRWKAAEWEFNEAWTYLYH